MNLATLPKTMQAQAVLGDLRSFEDNPNYFMERKLDGFRLLVVVEKTARHSTAGYVHGFSRATKDQDIESKLPHLLPDLKALAPAGGIILDGELTTFDDDFTHVGSVMKSLAPRARLMQTEKKLEYVVFDVLEVGGAPCMAQPQSTRNMFLDGLFEKRPDLSYVRQSKREDVQVSTIKMWIELGGEGAMIKHKLRPYIPGKRPMDTWYKVKMTQESDVIIVGYTKGQGKFLNMIGAIEFAQMKNGELVYRGRCSGMDDATRQDFTDHGKKYIGSVMAVKHMGAGTQDGYRHPQYKGLRTDKKAEECLWD